jgi:sulfoxide reductase heme-binding subunit YedZ
MSVGLGLSMGSPLVKRLGKSNLRVIHEALSLTTIAAIFLHVASLLADSYLHPTLTEVAIPFASSYETFWTGLGTIAGWGIVLLGGSYYLRRRIGQARWLALHRFTAATWLMGVVHSLGEGTDASQIWFLAMLSVVVLPALAMLSWRLSGSLKSRSAKRSTGAFAKRRLGTNC